MTKVLCFLAFVGVSFAHAAPAQKNTEWNKLVRDLFNKGTVYKQNEPNYVSFSFKRGTSYQLNEDRQVEYLTLAGERAGEHDFVPKYVSGVRETWTRKGKAWEVRQRITVADLSGTLTKIDEQIYLIEDNMIIGEEKLPTVAPDSPEGIELWTNEWTSWKELAEDLPDRPGPWYEQETEI